MLHVIKYYYTTKYLASKKFGDCTLYIMYSTIYYKNCLMEHEAFKTILLVKSRRMSEVTSKQFNDDLYDIINDLSCMLSTRNVVYIFLV